MTLSERVKRSASSAFDNLLRSTPKAGNNPRILARTKSLHH